MPESTKQTANIAEEFNEYAAPKATVADVHCQSCGAPARFDILKQQYHCDYCGSKIKLSQALEQKRGFREMHHKKMHNAANDYELTAANCSGCGAIIVFEEGEVTQTCPFCGKALVREKYLYDEEFPELIIPFRITPEEAQGLLEDWCRENSKKSEAKRLLGKIPEMQGCYLPYQLIRGPVHCKVSRMDRGIALNCEGYIDEAFVNCSDQLNNALLDGMEPYELDELTEFDFAFVAGHGVKIGDIDDELLGYRTKDEIQTLYEPVAQKTMETKAVNVFPNLEDAMRMPALLPAYYVDCDGVKAAVNGQTGKVSVRAEKDTHFFFLPRWLKLIIWLIVCSLVPLGAFHFCGMDLEESFYITGVLAFFFLIVLGCLFGDMPQHDFKVGKKRKIFTSSGGAWHRKDGKLVQDSKPLERQETPPVFLMELDGETRQIIPRFSTFTRISRMIILAIVALFAPVIVALFLNGFNFSQLALGGSAVWFCIAVPTVPIYVIKFGVEGFYDKPQIFLPMPDGSKKRYRKKRRKITKDDVKTVLGFMFIPPAGLIFWAIIISFCVMVDLTAFGF